MNIGGCVCLNPALFLEELADFQDVPVGTLAESLPTGEQGVSYAIGLTSKIESEPVRGFDSADSFEGVKLFCVGEGVGSFFSSSFTSASDKPAASR